MVKEFPITSEVIMSFEDSNDKRFVLLTKNSTGHWHLPFTFMGENESTLEAAQRLVREKINLNINKERFDFLNIYDSPKRIPKARRIAAVYFHFMDEVDSILVAKSTISNTPRKWFDVDKLPKLPFDHKQMVNDFLEQQYPVRGLKE